MDNGIKEAYKTLQELIVIKGSTAKSAELIQDLDKVKHSIMQVIFLLMEIEDERY